MALKAQQYQIVKAKDTKALLTSLLIIPELRVLVLTKRHLGSGNEIGAGWIFHFPTSCARARTRTAKRVTTKRARIRWASVNLKKSKKFQSFLPSQPEYQERLSGKGGGGGGVLTRLVYWFHVSAYKHLSAKGLPAAVILPGIKSNPGWCEEALR